MTEKQLQAAHQKLLARRHEILTRWRQRDQSAAEELETPEIEIAEKAAEDADAQRLSSLAEVDLRLVREIDAALKRIEEGRYGRCLRCSNPIERERLEVLPEAALCARCAELADKERPGHVDRWQ